MKLLLSNVNERNMIPLVGFPLAILKWYRLIEINWFGVSLDRAKVKYDDLPCLFALHSQEFVPL